MLFLKTFKDAKFLVDGNAFETLWRRVVVAACDRALDVAIVLDMSGSNQQLFDAMLDLTQRLTLGLPVYESYTTIAVVRYSDTANVSFYLDTYSTGEQVGVVQDIVQIGI